MIGGTIIRKAILLTVVAAGSLLGTGAANAGCTVNVGTCSSTGYCTVNVGHCTSGGRCTITVGYCYEGDSRLVAI